MAIPIRQGGARLPLSYTSPDIDFRSEGAIGDGTSHPLSQFFGSLATAQQYYPAATSLSDEIDWAVIQSAINANPGGCFVFAAGRNYLTNHRIWLPSDGYTFYGFGKASQITNTIAAANFADATIDSMGFGVGDMHPALQNTANSYAWPAYPLNDIAAGSTLVTVTTPGGVTQTISPGDIVIVRSNTNPVTTGTSTIYDYQMFNRVISYNAGTGALQLELPLEIPIGSTSSLTGPTLLVNGGSLDPFSGTMFRVAQDVTVSGLYITATLPFTDRFGGWRCSLEDLYLNVRTMASFNTFCQSTARNWKGYYRDRAMEIKFASQWSVLNDLECVYTADANVTSPNTTISIGEQSHGVDVSKLRVFRGTNYTSNVRILETYGQNNTIDCELYDYTSNPQAVPIAVKDITNLGRGALNNHVRVKYRGANNTLTAYVQIGSSTAGTVAPDKTWLDLDCLTTAGTVPSNLVSVLSGTNTVLAMPCPSDIVQSQSGGSGSEPIQNAPFTLTSVAGSVTYSAGTRTSVGGFTLIGCKTGDLISSTLQVVGSVTSGAASSLSLTTVCATAGTVTVYVTNQSGTDVTITGATAYKVLVTWRRMRG